MTLLDLDQVSLECDCPRCGFSNPFLFKQARVRDVIICRGCKANLPLDDDMNTCRKARRDVEHSMREFERSLAQLSRTITFSM